MKNEKGITLVALIVIIIVLLILAGISITMLTGDNGLLAKVQDAKEKTEQAKTNERLDLLKQEELIDEVLNGVNVEKVTDNKPGELEKENENTFIINSIEDLVFFAYDVTNGNNYEGKIVKLGTSLDFNSTKSYVDPLRTDYGKYGYDGELKTLLTTGEGFKSIGITTEDNKEKSLLGTFDGNNNFIKNLYINVISYAEHEKMGLFANNFGAIDNLKLVNVNLYLNNKNGQVAGIAGQNSSTGRINNCIVSGSVKFEGEQGNAGGITTYCSGKITNCGNLANIYCHNTHSYYGDGTGALNMGGLFGASGTNSEIINCYNKGNITAINENEGTLVGGIGGSSTGIIKNCYNTGNIYGKSGEYLRIGGILGNFTTNSIENCYSIGRVGKLEGDKSEAITIGMVLGRIYAGSKVAENLYYQKIDETLGIGINNAEIVIEDTDMQKTEEEMKSDNFLRLLNNGENIWKRDTNNINNGYPILYWQ